MITGIKIIEKYQKLLRKRDPIRDVFRLLYKYILMRPIDFGDTPDVNTFKYSVKGVSDDKVIEAARSSATALGGALWPHAGESFELVPLPDRDTGLDALPTDDKAKYAQDATRILRNQMDGAESGFMVAWSEYMDDQPVLGTSGIYGVEDKDDPTQPCKYRSVSAETAVFDEGPRGLIDTVYLEYKYTVRQVVEIYGEDKVSEIVLKKYRAGKDDEYVRVITAVEPRAGGKYGADIYNRPVAAYHVEVDTKNILLEEGFDEMPIFMSRFRKRANELYGRSLGMDALPSIRELNVLRASFAKALDKILDPPLGFYSEMVGGASTINLTAGKAIPLYMSGRIPNNGKPIEPLITVAEPRVAKERLDSMVEDIRALFLVDRLLDFNNKTRMTLGEAELRNDFRNQALNNIFIRQIVELLNPVVKWTFFVLYRRGLLGLHPVKDAAKIAAFAESNITPLVIPEEIAVLADRGVFPFTIRWISPAARAMKAEATLGVEKLVNLGFSFQNANIPDAMDNLDPDKVMRVYQDMVGSPTSVMRTPDDVKKIRKARQEALVQQAEVQQATEQAKAAAHGAQAYRNFTAANNGK